MWGGLFTKEDSFDENAKLRIADITKMKDEAGG